MRQFETETAPMRDPAAPIAGLVRPEMRTAEALALALETRDALIRLTTANGAGAESRAA
ncbi:hypothetical protein [Phenylobacterium sp.]|uniref:hypothetical protein n=1 Tax=Phenylobacterium sp. TaxID=1871053 RepID=UPI0035B4A744